MTGATHPGTRVLQDSDQELETPHQLVLLDDNEHTYAYVIHMLGAIFGYGREKAFAIACIVDNDGRAVLMTGSKGDVELKQEAVHAFGADPLMPECKGSMTAVVEPVA
ncbi:MAG: ATP-dependent Clp protease adaptor ClpS [Dehalococcoidia bacterium]